MIVNCEMEKYYKEGFKEKIQKYKEEGIYDKKCLAYEIKRRIETIRIYEDYKQHIKLEYWTSGDVIDPKIVLECNNELELVTFINIMNSLLE